MVRLRMEEKQGAVWDWGSGNGQDQGGRQFGVIAYQQGCLDRVGGVLRCWRGLNRDADCKVCVVLGALYGVCYRRGCCYSVTFGRVLVGSHVLPALHPDLDVEHALQVALLLGLTLLRSFTPPYNRIILLQMGHCSHTLFIRDKRFLSGLCQKPVLCCYTYCVVVLDGAGYGTGMGILRPSMPTRTDCCCCGMQARLHTTLIRARNRSAVTHPGTYHGSSMVGARHCFQQGQGVCVS